MTTLKTSDLTGAALDWAVAKAENGHAPAVIGGRVFEDDGWKHHRYSPSIDWAIAGPIIEREHISLFSMNTFAEGCCAHIHKRDAADGKIGPITARGYGPTKLIAAMRAYVQSNLGDAVDIPDELSP